MGHSDIQTTLNIYAEVDKSVKKKAMLQLEGKIVIKSQCVIRCIFNGFLTHFLIQFNNNVVTYWCGSE